MTVFELKTMRRCEINEDTVVALGTFDGCHAGHMSVFNNAKSEAKEKNIKTVAYTFDSVRKSFDEKKETPCIFTLEEKIKFIREVGMDYIAIDSLDKVRELSGEEFFRNILLSSLHAASASCGFNYKFGKNAVCTAEDLRRFFEKIGGSVRISEKISLDGVTLSSTLIRNLIENGEVEKILRYSSPYSIYAKVINGKQLGRKIGFRTINQKIPDGKVVLARGVYITECEIGEDVYPSVTNVGMRPTTDGEDASENAETHIIGYNGNLYSSYVRVRFYKFLRSEKKFDSVEELKNQIFIDKENAKKYFAYGGDV